MIISPMQWILGILAGGTIFLGLPVAVLPNVSQKARAFLVAVSTGILVYLLVEITSEVCHEGVEELLGQAVFGSPLMWQALYFALIFVVGLSVGLLSLVWFEQKFIRQGNGERPPKEAAERVAFMIAVGIGLHNFSEGLAIGQQFSWGDAGFAIFLAIGFGLHNATEGFGIAAPLTGHKPSWRYLALLGLIGGLPTLFGTLIGGSFQSDTAKFLFLSLASGSILYVIGELLHIGRKLKGEALTEIGLLVGFVTAFATAMLITMAGGPS